MTTATFAQITAADYFEGQPFESFDLTNKDDVFDLVLDRFCTYDQLQTIAGRLYEDKRGGPLVDLLTNEEFTAAICAQMAAAEAML